MKLAYVIELIQLRVDRANKDKGVIYIEDDLYKQYENLLFRKFHDIDTPEPNLVFSGRHIIRPESSRPRNDKHCCCCCKGCCHE